MKTVRRQFGPFKQQPYFSDSEIENTCSDELARVNLLPTKPEPIRIDRFIEKRFKVVPSYEELPEGVLGMTKFVGGRVAEIIVAKSIDKGDQSVRAAYSNALLCPQARDGYTTRLFLSSPIAGKGGGLNRSVQHHLI